MYIYIYIYVYVCIAKCLLASAAARQNIAEYGKLNFHYYRSLKKSLGFV